MERQGPWGHKVGLWGFTRVGKAFEEVKVLNFFTELIDLLQSEILKKGQMDGLNDRPTDGQTDRWKDQQTQKDRPISLNGTNGFEKNLEQLKAI